MLMNSRHYASREPHIFFSLLLSVFYLPFFLVSFLFHLFIKKKWEVRDRLIYSLEYVFFFGSFVDARESAWRVLNMPFSDARRTTGSQLHTFAYAAWYLSLTMDCAWNETNGVYNHWWHQTVLFLHFFFPMCIRTNIKKQKHTHIYMCFLHVVSDFMLLSLFHFFLSLNFFFLLKRTMLRCWYVSADLP